ncbi:MAG: glycerol-3-phosphate 1-O-acyltransferase PlsY [Puniceicoccales bacterium]|nr:glycerol-3-phosphate 1-O-acyltransferase PlsY [Puniceicoccales bacterium]
MGFTSFSFAFSASVGYLLGSLPFGYLVAKMRGVNIFAVGSGNVGATNVRRSVGCGAGAIVFLLDAAKGFAAVAWPLHHCCCDVSRRCASIGLLAALLGHMFSIFLRFRGGKGVSVAIGGFLALEANVLLLALAAWAVVFAFGRFVSLASIFFALMLPLCSYLFYYPPFENVVALAVAAMIIGRHWQNIRRLLDGTEHGFGKESGK